MPDIAINILEKHARGGTWWFDTESQELWWSHGIYKLHGLDPENGPPSLEYALDFYDPDSRTQMQAALATAIEQGTGWNLTLQIIRADGELRHVQAMGQAELRPGRPPLLAGAFFDVHLQVMQQRKRQDSARRMAAENTRWRIAGESVGLGVVDIDFDRSTYNLSGPFASYLGLDPSNDHDIPCSEWLQRIHRDDRGAYQSKLDAHVAGDTRLNLCEFRVRLSDSREVWVKQAGRCIRDDTGSRLVGTLSDITESKRSQMAVQESQRLLEETLRHAPIGIALVAPDGRWLSVNRALCDMIGYSEQELLRLGFQDITHPHDLESDLAHVHALLDGSADDYQMEKRYFHKNGNIRNSVWTVR